MNVHDSVSKNSTYEHENSNDFHELFVNYHSLTFPHTQSGEKLANDSMYLTGCPVCLSWHPALHFLSSYIKFT